MDESLDVSAEVVADTTATDSSTVENTSSEVTDEFEGLGDIDLSNASAEVKPTEAQPDKEAETNSENKTEAKSQGEETLSPKSNNRFQQLANDNRELREQIERLKSQEAQVANEQELLNEVNPETGDYYTPQEVERIAFQKSREVQQQTIAQQRQALEVQSNQQNLASDATKALNDFPMFDEDSKEYNPVLAAKADRILGANLIRSDRIPEIDPRTGQPTGLGMVINSRIPPYLIYQTIADATQEGQTRGQASAQKATERMLANADRSSDAPTKGSGDPMADLEERIGNYRFSG